MSCETDLLVRYKNYTAEPDFTIELARRLETGETLASAPTLTCIGVLQDDDGAGATTDLTITGVVISGTKILASIADGKCLTQVSEARWETRYLLAYSVVLSSGEVEADTVILVVYDAIERT